MKNTKKIILIIAIIICIILVFGIQFLYKNTQEKILNSLVSTISSMNLLNDTLVTNNPTFGKYTKVETAIQSCIKDYCDLCIKISEYSFQDEISKFLNNESQFNNINQFLIGSRANVSNQINTLNDKCTETSVMSYIHKENLNDYYTNLYKKLMLDNNTVKSNMDKTKSELIDMLNSLQNIFDYLLDNQSKWSINNHMFYFSDNESLAEYNNLIADLNDKISVVEHSQSSSSSNSYLSLDDITK